MALAVRRGRRGRHLLSPPPPPPQKKVTLCWPYQVPSEKTFDFEHLANLLESTSRGSSQNGRIVSIDGVVSFSQYLISSHVWADVVPSSTGQAREIDDQADMNKVEDADKPDGVGLVDTVSLNKEEVRHRKQAILVHPSEKC